MLNRIFRLLKKDSKNTNTSGGNTKSNNGYYLPLSSSELLSTPLREKYLTDIWQNVSMTPKMFDSLYRKPIEQYAEIVQLLPASESHHHAHNGGMLDHGLEVLSIAAKLRQNYVLPPNSPPEEQAKQKDVWTAVVIYAALLHDLGKSAVDIEVVLENGQRWFPWQGKINQPYRFRYIKSRDYSLHPVMGGVFAQQFIPQEALNWIAEFPIAFSSLMYFINGHSDKAGVLSDIVQRADQISVTMALGGDIQKIGEKTQVSFAKQLHIALIEVVKGMKLNAPKGGGEGWLTSDGLWVMSKTTADKIRAYLIQQGIPAPSLNSRMFDELQSHKLIEPTSANTAIWETKITSNEGWNPDGPFKLLRISPNVIWENIDDRPKLFDGLVTVLTKDEKNMPQARKSEISEDTVTAITNTFEVPETGIANNVPFLGDDSESLPKTEMILNSEPDNKNISTETETDPFANYLDLFPALDKGEQILQQKQEDKTNNHTEAGNEIADISVSVPENNDSEKVPQKVESKSRTLKKSPINEVKSKHKPKQTETAIQLTPEKFIDWVKEGIINKSIHINKPDAKLHFVEDHLFMVTPAIFQLCTKELLGSDKQEDWELLQKQFQELGLHKRLYENGDTWNIWTCDVVGQKRTSSLSGYLIEDVKFFVGNKPVFNNYWLKLKGNV